MKIHRLVTFAILIGMCLPQARAGQAELFDRLTGTWDVEYEIYGKDGKQSL